MHQIYTTTTPKEAKVMHTVTLLIMGMALGFISLLTYGFIGNAVTSRLNNGQKVHFDGKLAGYIVVCRYNGMKKFFFVDNEGELNHTSHYERSAARKACRQNYLDNMVKIQNARPKHTSFARAI